MTTYPIVIKASALTIYAWQSDEEGSFEDHSGAADHVYALLGRYKSKIVINNAAEAATLVTSGTYHGGQSGWDDDDGRQVFRAAVKRLTDKVRTEAGDSITRGKYDVWGVAE